MAKRNATPPSRQQSPNWQQKQQAQAAQRINHEMEDALSDGIAKGSDVSHDFLRRFWLTLSSLQLFLTVELKFLMNLPDTELQSSERLFFQIEQVLLLFISPIVSSIYIPLLNCFRRTGTTKTSSRMRLDHGCNTSTYGLLPSACLSSANF